MAIIRITGWQEGADKIGADRLLAYEVGLGLKVGKSIVDKVMAGGDAEFQIDDEQDAAPIVAKLQRMNFDVQIR